MELACTLRPIPLPDIPPADLDFLRRVYRSTREAELALTQWDEAQKHDFIQMQFTAQHQYYLANYPGAEFYVILVADQPAGRLYLHRRQAEIRIMDIALLPEFCGKGVGTRLLKEILAEGQRLKKQVTIHVERFNPALRLYERLGFRLLEDKGVYWFMGWDGEP